MDRPKALRLVTGITLARIPLVFLFMVSAVIHSTYPARVPWLFWVALVAFATAALTDLFDGYLARRLNVTTTFGAHADPLTDKIFYLTALPVLVFLAAANGNRAHAALLLVMTVLFLSRDQWVSFLRSIGAEHGVSPCANWSGKVRTAVSFPLIGVIYICEAMGFTPCGGFLLPALEIAAIGLNLVSIYVYTVYYLPCLRKSLNA